jgi:signal transduction histidine kinase
MKSVNDCQEQLESLQKEMDEFSYIVAHDLKAPIRAITNLSTWIEEDLGTEISEDVHQNMSLLRNRAERLERMIEALLQYSRVNRYYLEIDEIDVEDTVKKIADRHSNKIELVIPAPLPIFKTYRTKLEQVLEKLFLNIVTFNAITPVVATITCTEINSNYYEFKISDNGIGVPTDVLDKIFTLFYTVSPKDTLNTLGAGLAITKKIVNFAGGTIHAEQKTNENGLIISFTWPKSIIKN